MASDSRKFMVASSLRLEEKNEACYMCYVCPDYCTKYKSRQPPSAPPQKNQMPSILIIMLCVLGAVILFMSYLIARCQSRNARRRDSQQSENDEHGLLVTHPFWFVRTIGLPQSTIDSVGEVRFKKGGVGIEGSDCSICLSEFQENERLRILPNCRHAFHLPCIDTWLSSHINCPVCRAVPIPAGDEIDAAGGDLMEAISRSTGEADRRDVHFGLNAERRNRAETFNVNFPIEIDPTNDKFRVRSDLGHHRVNLEQHLLSVRRSASMDFSPRISHATDNEEGCSFIKLSHTEKQNLELMTGRQGSRNSSIYRLIKSSSCRRSLQKGPVQMKRSSSYAGKCSFLKRSSSRLDLGSMQEAITTSIQHQTQEDEP